MRALLGNSSRKRSVEADVISRNGCEKLVRNVDGPALGVGNNEQGKLRDVHHEEVGPAGLEPATRPL
jgi:hypothetical protein